ncbi:hypothetical protein MLD38_000397 [Melastoma candidum]|uniref:Uncharacterized protein n=1 Tax=Melastoma candidum TaxID=119954 RepID=A0ACB9S9I5_9MYRT|nr:hypothetical protein MLD38_000397 [Melastoma candidum]
MASGEEELSRVEKEIQQIFSTTMSHLISDAHEWINEIPTVPVYYPAKPQPRERAWRNQRIIVLILIT